MRHFLSRFKQRTGIPSMFGDVELVDDRDSSGEKVTLMKLGQSLQSATYHGKLWSFPPFAYVRAFDRLFDSDMARVAAGMDPVSDILLLGGGGFSYPKHVLTSKDDVSMDVVEIDPVIVEIAREYLHLDELEEALLAQGRSDRLGIFIEDGMSYLATCNVVYDAVINDVFRGGSAVDSFLSEEGIHLVKRRLKEGGMYLSNFVVDLTREGPAALNGYVDRLNECFAYVHVIDASDEEFGGADNFIVLATDLECEFRDVIPY